METKILNHPKLGAIRGKLQEKTVQYLALKYGNLEHPLGTATLCHKFITSPYDATHSGPAAVQFPQSCDIEHSLIQHSLLLPDERTFSDINCLNLNITVPLRTNKEEKLPVLVWIHGGGLCMGSNNWPQYDPTRLATLSAAQNLPTIIVSINYRLGVYGFATTKALRMKDFKPNNGLRDQKLALEWIEQNISGFEGDAKNITVIGQSAGAASASLHLLSDRPLFRRLICLGGSPLLLPLLDLESAENLYGPTLANAGVGSEMKLWLSDGQPPEQVTNALGPFQPTFPTIDGDIIPHALKHSQIVDQSDTFLPGVKWCQEILVGCSSMESTIFESRLLKSKEFLALAFQRSLYTIFPDQISTADTLLTDYGIVVHGDKDSAKSYSGVLQFLQDLLFVAPAIALVGACKKSYVFSLEEPNPWDGPFVGKASHIFDVALLFQNYSEHLSREQDEIAKVFGLDVLKFVNGIAPWKAYAKPVENVKKYCSASQGSLGDEFPILLGRNAVISKYIDLLGFEELVRVWIGLEIHIQSVAYEAASA